MVVYQHHQMKIFNRVESFVKMLKNSPCLKQVLQISTKKEPQFPEDNDFEGEIEIRSYVHLCVFERV